MNDCAANVCPIDTRDRTIYIGLGGAGVKPLMP